MLQREMETADARSPERGAREWRWILVILLAAVVLWVPYYWHMRDVALLNPDAQDYAQIARNIARGDGMVTNTMPLSGLEWMRQTGRLGQPWWNVHRFPLPPLIEAGLFRVLGPTDLAASLVSALFFFASIPLVFLFARRLFTLRASLLATVLFTFGGGPMKDSITGLTEPAATFFFLSALYFALWPRGWKSYALAGLLTGLGFLNRSSVVLYGLPMLFLIWQAARPRSWRALAAFCLPGAAVIAPWLWRTMLVAGDPMFSLTSALMVPYMTDVSRGTHGWYTFGYESAGHFIAAHPISMVKKWVTQMGGLWWQDVSEVGDIPALVPFFALGLLKPYAGVAGRLRRWLLVVFALHFVVMALLSNIPRYYAIFTPFLAIYAADILLGIWDQLRPRASRRAVAAAGVVAVPLLLGWASILGPPQAFRRDRVRFETRPENAAWLRENTPKDALIVTDIPWSVAWYADRRALSIPPTPDEMGRYADYGLQPAGIYLKHPEWVLDLPREWNEWRFVQFGARSVPGYRVAHRFADGSVYLTRVPADARG
jgi:4-amino-4-deoxy-L-arabinose transferase-like glycosyltransferase